MYNLQAGDQDALAGLVDEHADAVEVTAPFLHRINQIGNLDSLHVIGTFANPPGNRLHQGGPWTTFVYAEFENWNQYWNLVWNEDATFAANLSGPWPTFTLIPVEDKRYIAVNKSEPYGTISLRFSDGCIVTGGISICADR